MKKEVCLMCIVCFFLGYFVCDVIGKCGFKKPPPPPPPHEHYGDYGETNDFKDPNLSSDSQNLRAVGGYPRREYKNDNNKNQGPGGEGTPCWANNTCDYHGNSG